MLLLLEVLFVVSYYEVSSDTTKRFSNQSWVGEFEKSGTSLLRVAIGRTWKYQFSRASGLLKEVMRLN
jgi:hypothetical protein